MENVCELCCQADYFETPAWGKLILPLQLRFYLKIPDQKLQGTDNNLFHNLLPFKAFKCQGILAA
jgi:hypothetical protein